MQNDIQYGFNLGLKVACEVVKLYNAGYTVSNIQYILHSTRTLSIDDIEEILEYAGLIEKEKAWWSPNKLEDEYTPKVYIPTRKLQKNED